MSEQQTTMNKKQQETTQSAEVTQQGSSSLSTPAEQVEMVNQFPLPTELLDDCPQCHGIGVIAGDGEDVPCPLCSGIPLDPVKTPLTSPLMAGDGTVGQVCHPAPQGNSGPRSAFNAAEQQCPNCHGKRFFTEKVRNDEGQIIDANVDCARCNGLGYILVPLHSPVLEREKALASEWPTAPLEVNWPWVGEPDPTVGTVVGWNWETEEIAVITKQPQFLNMKPWKVTIELKPMPKELLFCRVIGIDEPVVHEDVDWYARWIRIGKKPVPNSEDSILFSGRCLVQVQA